MIIPRRVRNQRQHKVGVCNMYPNSLLLHYPWMLIGQVQPELG